MQKILRKRILRDLKENFFRYLALMLLIILGMYMVIATVGAADTIINGTRNTAEANLIEDGQFSLFSPLTDSEILEIDEEGVTLEEHFYLDFEKEDGSVLRIFCTREKIDLAAADSGNIPENDYEIFLEKRYCEENGIVVGDSVSIGGREFTVSGIGSVPDYESVVRNMSDSSIDSKAFGFGFVTEKCYDTLKRGGRSVSSEEYIYAYRLGGHITDKELKEMLQEYKISADDIKDDFFKEYWEGSGGKLDEFRDALDELDDGAEELSDGMEKLNQNSGKLKNGSSKIFQAFLESANDSLASFGVPELTADNYKTVLGKLHDESFGLMALKLSAVKEQLEALDDFDSGINKYTDGVSDASDGAGELSDGVSELKKEADKFLDENLDLSLSKMTQFILAEDNPRIGAAADDKAVDHAAGLAAGVIVLVLFAYVISVFTIHGIEWESGVIGTLYAMGVKKNELLRHYLTLPVVISLIAGIIGTVTGYSSFGAKMMLSEPYRYFSMPQIPVLLEPYLLIYGIIMPPVAAAVTNFLVIRKKLEMPALSLIRGEQKSAGGRKLRFRSSLVQGNFVRVFQIRQLLREIRTALTIFFGMFISLLVVMLSLNCYVMCQHLKTDSVRDTKFEYMYTYKYPEETIPKGGEEAYGVSMKKEVLGYNLDVTLLGIHDDNPYFDASVENLESGVAVSSAAAEKFHLKKGDILILNDEENDRDYAFSIEEVVNNASGFYAFMDIDNLRELMGEDDKYYNIVFSDHALDIENGRLYSTLSRKDVKKSSAVFAEMMKGMVYSLLVVSVLIFVVIMYLMMKVMIDRQTMHISMFKIFGYRKKEIGKLYLNGNLLVVVCSALIGIPLSKTIMNAMYPYLVSNVACSVNLTFSWQIYALLFTVVLVLYFMINKGLVRRINKILPAEMLKNRE